MAAALFALVAGLLAGAVIGWRACCTFVGKNWDHVAAEVQRQRRQQDSITAEKIREHVRAAIAAHGG